MAESIVKVPSTASGDFDFLGFSFAGKHSWDDFGIYRTSDGDRYNDELAPPMQDLTADVPGGDGQYYFGTFHKPKVFNVNFAFDNMSEVTYREMKKWLNGKEMGDLWFEEAPYKVYTAKVTGTPQMKSLCFDKYNEETERMERVYKGDGTIQFTAYWPYAHTPDFVEDQKLKLPKGSSYFFKPPIEKDFLEIEVIENEGNAAELQIKKVGNNQLIGVSLNTQISIENEKIEEIRNNNNADIIVKLYFYNESGQKTEEPIYYNGKKEEAYFSFENKDQWKEASGITENFSQGENNGSLPAHFILRAPQLINKMEKSALIFKVGDLSITVPAATVTKTTDSESGVESITYTHYESIEWDSKTGIVSAMVLPTSTAVEKKRKPIPFTGNSLGAIPANSTVTWGLSNGAETPQYSTTGFTLDYHYWYY